MDDTEFRNMLDSIEIEKLSDRELTELAGCIADKLNETVRRSESRNKTDRD